MIFYTVLYFAIGLLLGRCSVTWYAEPSIMMLGVHNLPGQKDVLRFQLHLCLLQTQL